MGYIKFENDVRAFMEVGLITPPVYQQAYIYGTEGRIEVNAPNQPLVRVKGKGDADWRVPEIEPQSAFRLEIEAMLESIETGKEHILNGRQGRAAMEVLMAIIESARNQQVISFPFSY